MASEAEQELDDRWWLGLRARTLHSLEAAEFSVVLHFGEGSALTIQSTAIIRPATGQVEVPAVTQSEDGTFSTSDALRALVGQKVLSGVGFKTGSLRLFFESGVMLTVPADERYEAWHMTGPTGRTWVSLPGGGLSSFPADPS